MRAVRVASIAVALCLLAPPALAGEPGAPADTARARAVELERALDAGAPYARRWYWGWSGAFAAASALSFASLAVFDDPGLRADAVVAGTLAGLGAATTLGIPLTASGGARAVTAAEPDARARAAEARLRRAAREERFLSGWVAHAGIVASNAAATAVSRGVYHRPWDMIALSRATGLLIGELKVLSTPTDAIADEARLLDELVVTPTVGGLALSGRF